MKISYLLSLTTLSDVAIALLVGVSLAANAQQKAAAAVQPAKETNNGEFRRTLQVTEGTVDLDVSTEAGDIYVGEGLPGSVMVIAIIKASDAAGMSAEQKFQALAALPPVEQHGNSIQIGRIHDAALSHGVRIAYSIIAPVNSKLKCKTGSGDLIIIGLQAVDCATGIGNIEASYITGQVEAHTGAGNITLDSIEDTATVVADHGNISITRSHNAIAETGDGDVNLRMTGPNDVTIRKGSGRVTGVALYGQLRARSANGDIRLETSVHGPWDVKSEAGALRLRIPNTDPFEIDARSGSGRILNRHPEIPASMISENTLRGKVNGGGPMLTMETGTGDIDIAEESVKEVRKRRPPRPH